MNSAVHSRNGIKQKVPFTRFFEQYWCGIVGYIGDWIISLNGIHYIWGTERRNNYCY